MKQFSNDDQPSTWRTFRRQLSNNLLAVGIALYIGSTMLACAISWWKRASGPEIVVYMDKGATQPAILPLPESKVITGDRAALWWTVYNKALEKQSAGDARYTASGAVDNVYGPVK